MSKELKSVEYGLEKIFEGAQDFLPLMVTEAAMGIDDGEYYKSWVE